jgi:hypothetical protein
MLRAMIASPLYGSVTTNVIPQNLAADSRRSKNRRRHLFEDKQPNGVLTRPFGEPRAFLLRAFATLIAREFYAP